jgi:hypothetical protein
MNLDCNEIGSQNKIAKAGENYPHPLVKTLEIHHREKLAELSPVA